MKREKLEIVYEDSYFIAVNKKSGLLTIANKNERERTLYREVSDYVKKQHKSNKIFIIHRLDKDTSGIVLFAKSYEIKEKMQQEWNAVRRLYIALVEGKVKKDNDTIKSYIAETKTLYSYSTNHKKSGKLAITEYKKINANNQYTMLEINILTGRKNQIRVHLSDIGNPIVGDKKYNSKKNPIRRMCLHAYKMEFIHPKLNKLITLETKMPKQFEKLIKM